MATDCNPKDSMKSTWFDQDKSEWTIAHKILARRVSQWPKQDEIPVHAKTDPIPYLGQITQLLWILKWAAMPMLVHQAMIWVTGWQSLPMYLAFPVYAAGLMTLISQETRVCSALGRRYGYLDGDVHARDGVPDVAVKRVVGIMLKGMSGRITLMLLCAYRSAETPLSVVSSPQWWASLAVGMALYGLTVDFWFYCYHRAVHVVPALWRVHRTHHLTKHPNPLLSGYADDEQELIEIFGVPGLAYLSLRFAGIHLDFYHWWLCHALIIYAEFMGHSGLRIIMSPPSLINWLLVYFDAALTIEDHDLHHRKGWRRSFNYGKQTRVWDRLFGTCFERYEADNIDYKNQIYLPLF